VNRSKTKLHSQLSEETKDKIPFIRKLKKMRFSISTKLISIITIITIAMVSLGSITILVSRLLRQDLQIAAEENNFEINRRSAMEMELVLINVFSNSRMILQIITAAEAENTATKNAANQGVAQNAIEFFFEENPQIAALFFTTGTQADRILVNSRFFHSKEIDEAFVDSYWKDNVTALRRAAAGETLLLNAAPCFIVPVLALFFPWHNGSTGVLFSPAELDNTFCFGANQSYLLNDSGDILIHSDFELVRDGVNIADNDFTRYVWDNQVHNSHTLYTSEDGIRYFRAFTKLNTGGCTVITGIEYDKVFEGMAAATRRIIYLTATVLFISIMFIWFFAKGIFNPWRSPQNKEEPE
jgi:adenylate cyclase